MNATTLSTSKEFRKNIDIRQKVHHGGKAKKIKLPDENFVYGYSKPDDATLKDLITYTYGNRAEELLKKDYEQFIKEKTKVCSKPPKVIPRFISPKVEEMKKKEEERKANDLDYVPEEDEKEKEKQKEKEKEKEGTEKNDEEEESEKKDEKPLYKLKMFQNVGSKVAEGIKQFKTFKQYKIKKPVEDNNGLDKIINKVQDEIKQQEQIEQPVS